MLEALKEFGLITNGGIEQTRDWAYTCNRFLADFLQTFSGQQKSNEPLITPPQYDFNPHT